MFIYNSGTTNKPNTDSNKTESSALNFIPKGSDSDGDDDDDDDDDELIDITQMNMKKSTPVPKVDYSKFDNIVEGAIENDKISREKSKEALPQKQASNDNIFDSNKEGGDIVQNMLSNKDQPDIEAIKLKYKSNKIPQLPHTKEQLQKRVEKHLAVIPKLLDGEISMTYFYELAKLYRNSIPNDTLRQRDKYLINWDEFTGGYYGLNRQFFISSLIIAQYKPELIKKSTKNPTLSFWGVEDFSKFILANEVIVRLIMEDYECDVAKAESIIKSTSEYGRIVSDSEALEDVDSVNDKGEESKENKSNDKGKALDAIFGSD